MPQTLYCNDLFNGCTAVVHGNTTDEILSQASEHVCNVHGVCEVSPELERQVREAIRHESQPA
jgi:predicted small metal-binding protein